MKGFGLFLLSALILGMLIAAIYKRISFPVWARWRPSAYWGISFFDRNEWIKKILIRSAQLLVLGALLFILLSETSINLALKMLPAKIPKL